jgi:demethylmenaquinone methyltransferase/2-methoxy-6-polyprenyl-1,4-benzoquinol methylase
MPQKNSSGFPLQNYYSRIYKNYDLVNRLFTFGLDKKWRSQTVSACLASHPRSVLDICCGTGDLAIQLSRSSFQTLRVTGLDLNPDMLEIARQKADHLKIPSVEFILGDVGSMPFKDHEFDCATIGFGFRNLTYENQGRDQYLHEISRIIKPGGRLLILESAQPETGLIRFFYRLYLNMILVPLGGMISGDWSAYRYLAKSSSGFYSFSVLREMLARHSFTLKTEKKYLFGSVNLLIANKNIT